MATISNKVAGELNIVLYHKDTFAKRLTIRNRSTRVPIDLTGSIVEWNIKRKMTDPSPIKVFTIGDGVSFDGPGQIVLSIAAQQTIPAGTYEHDITITISGTAITYAAGTLIKNAGGKK